VEVVEGDACCKIGKYRVEWDVKPHYTFYAFAQKHPVDGFLLNLV